MGADVFISLHTDTSKELAGIIARILEEHDVKCFYAARDVSHDEYAEQIFHAIQECKAFVLLLNREASNSVDVKKEIDLMMNRVRAHEKIVQFILQLSDRKQLNGGVQYYVTDLHMNNGMIPPVEERAKELAFKIIDTLKRTEIMNESNAGNTSLSFVTVKQNLNFVGREKLLDGIHKAVQENRVVFLKGVGGIGKSEAVRQYIRRYGGIYRNGIQFVFYKKNLMNTIIDDSPDGIRIHELNRFEGESEQDYYHRKLAYLQEHVSLQTLIVIDNFDVDTDENLQDILGLGCCIIFTTRVDHSHTGQKVIPLGELEEEEQISLMQKYCKLIQTDNDRRDAREITHIVHGHTITLILIAELMQRLHKRPTNMLSMLREQGIATVLDSKTLSKSDTASAFDRIRKLFNLFSLTEQERYVMTNMALMPPEGIGFSMFMDLCGLEDGTELDDLINSSWLMYDEFVDRVSMHPLIAEVVVSECRPCWENCHALIENLAKQLPHDASMIRNEKDDILQYYNIAMSVFRVNPDLVFGYQDYWRSVYIAAFRLVKVDMDFWDKCIEYQQEHYGENSPQMVYAYYIKSDLYSLLGDFSSSAVWLKRAYEATSKGSPNSIDRAYLLRFYADNIMRGDPENFDRRKTREMFDEALKLAETATEDGILVSLANRDTGLKGTILAAIAGYYLRIDEDEKAIEYAEESCQLFLSDPENVVQWRWASTPLMTKALSCARLKRREEAIQCADKAFELRRQQYPETNLGLLRLRINYAKVMHYMGDDRKAQEILADVKRIFEEQQYIYTPLYQELLQMIACCGKTEA